MGEGGDGRGRGLQPPVEEVRDQLSQAFQARRGLGEAGAQAVVGVVRVVRARGLEVSNLAFERGDHAGDARGYDEVRLSGRETEGSTAGGASLGD